MSPFRQGDLVRVTKKWEGDPDFDAADVGVEAEIEDYVSAEEAEDGVAFYWASNRGGVNNVILIDDGLVLVKSASEMAPRTVPSVAQIVSHLVSAVHDLGDDFEVHESGPDGLGALEIYGTTNEGLGFGARIVVSEVWETDD